MSNLSRYFPLIRTREEILADIHSSHSLLPIWESWRYAQQQEFLDFCSGSRGIKMLYDSFFKEIFNPETTPERLIRLLSLLLGRPVASIQALTNDTTRLADEQTLLITDMVVELEDGSIVNVEVQKVGYKFLGHRSACYSSDLLLRQYKRIRSISRKEFSYSMIRPVVTIIFMENSPAVFHMYPGQYLHRFEQSSDTGMQMDLLQSYLYIPLDIFKNALQDNGIQNELDAWLAFLSCDDPDIICRLIEAWPEFRPLYEQAYQMCRNMEDIMGFFSDELRILDRNTVQLMIDEMQESLEEKTSDLVKKSAQIEALDARIVEQSSQIAEQNSQIAEQNSQITEQNSQIAEQNSQIAEQQSRIAELEQLLAAFRSGDAHKEPG